MNLKTWAQETGISYRTARQWYKDGKLPVPAKRCGGLILVDVPRMTLSGARGDKKRSEKARAFLHVAFERLEDPAAATIEERWANRVAYLIRHRRQQGISQTELDARAGWADGLAAKYESLVRRPNWLHYECWLEALGLDIEFVSLAA